MKTAILCVALFSSTQVTAIETHSNLPITIPETKPTTVIFNFVRGHKLGNAHSVQWSMASNAGIERCEVESTYEAPTGSYSNWYIVGNVNNFNANMFKFADYSVLPVIINYGIVAVLTKNMGTVISDIYTTTIN